jgi:hypothetical protein
LLPLLLTAEDLTHPHQLLLLGPVAGQIHLQ